MTSVDDDFTGLRALYINCTLKRSPERSHTQGLIDISTGIMEKHGIAVDVVRVIDHQCAPRGPAALSRRGNRGW
jgi:hypothetical protein